MSLALLALNIADLESDFEDGSRLSELIRIGIIATKHLGKRLTTTGKFTENEVAHEARGCKDRDGWRIGNYQ